LFHGFDTLGSPLEGRRVPWLRRETCPLASHKRTLIQLLTVNTSRPWWQSGGRRGRCPLWPLSPLRTRGHPAYCSAGFLRREIKRNPQSTRSWRRRTGQAGGDIWAHRSSEWPSDERERELLSEQEWPSAEREQVVSEGEDRDEITTCVSNVRKKEILGGNQRRHILQACVSSTKLSVTDFIARYQYDNDQ
jgi:hypothetical protein